MSLILTLRVVPSSGKQGCIVDKAGNIKVYLKSPPEKGKANNELIKLLAKSLSLAQADLEIIGGETSRKKMVKIHKPYTLDAVLKALGLEKQEQIFT